MTRILDLLIVAEYDLLISEVMNELSYEMSIEKKWLFLLFASERLVRIENECDNDRSHNTILAYRSLYGSWWEVRNMRKRITKIKNLMMDIETVGIVGGGL